MGSKKLRNAEPREGFAGFVEQHGRAILGLFVLALVVHDIFGAHGFIAMRHKQSEIERVKKDLDRLNKENAELGQQVKALKTDPKLIEKIAREDLQRARPGEIIIRIPPSQQPAGDSPPKP
jgi:cell division protein FtsB